MIDLLPATEADRQLDGREHRGAWRASARPLVIARVQYLRDFLHGGQGASLRQPKQPHPT